MSYDYVIVGGGISGVFLTYKLMESGKSILLLESSNRLGGKLHYNQQMKVELGGARFSSEHKKVISLVDELNLSEDKIELPEDDKIVYKMKHKVNLENLHKKILAGSKDYSKKYLQGITYRQLCYDILGQDVSDIYQDMFGYDSEFIHLNAHAMITMFGSDLLKESQYYILKNGYESIITKMKESFKDNVEIKMNTMVEDIGNNYVEYKKGKTYFRKCILCIPQKSLQKIEYLKQKEELNSVVKVPLLRIYMKYPKTKGSVWFKNIQRTVTDSYIRHIIPIDYERGVIMISYTDGDYANMWNDLVKLGNTRLVQKLHSEIKRLFKITPPKPDSIECAYWDDGVHMWKAGVNIKEEYEKILQINSKVFIAGESYSLHQCWVEGCLDMCYDVLEKMDERFKREIPKKETENKKTKVYSIDQVLKEKTWIIMDVQGKKKIYDVKKWLTKHPGGKANLQKGIDANNHYKDPKKYSDSPKDLFNSISAHRSGDVVKKMLKTPNEYVVFVGLLKKI